MSLQGAIAEAIETAYREMDPKTGMYPEDWTCSRCGKVLNADGGHPAELYAGTFNGLCYRCTGSSGYVMERYVLDGALRWSYPPHCPSWRRDRETFLAYEGCAACDGKGVTGRRTGGSRVHCKACVDRFTNHPDREAARRTVDAVQKEAQLLFEQELCDALGVKLRRGKDGRLTKKTQETLADAVSHATETRDAVRERLWSVFGPAIDKAREARRKLDEVEEVS